MKQMATGSLVLLGTDDARGQCGCLTFSLSDCRVKGNLITRSNHVGVQFSSNEWMSYELYEKYVRVYEEYELLF